MSAQSSSARPSYAETLLADLKVIADQFSAILSVSRIENVDPNRGMAGSGLVFLGYANWGWANSDGALETDRMALLKAIREWEPRCRLLFQHPTPEVKKRLDKNLKLLKRWLVRPGRNDHDIPSTIAAAQDIVRDAITDLEALVDLLPADDTPVRLVVDTNALIDNPDLAAYIGEIGTRYVVHLLPVVLREIDDLKRAGRNEQLRDAAKRADRRLKGIRHNGDIRQGVRVEGDVVAKFEHIEPRSADLPDWLDLTVADDRLVASALLLQSEHPGSTLYVATGDINMQTKLSAVGIPFVEPPM